MSEEYKEKCSDLMKKLSNYLNDQTQPLKQGQKISIIEPSEAYKTRAWIETNLQGEKRIRFNAGGMETLSVPNHLLLKQLEGILLEEERVDEAYETLREQSIIT